MADRKLQVFVSSTYLDLKEERQAAVEAILLAGHIPAGMELFSAGNESQWETIKRWIDESDVLLLILGQRYGSLEPKSKKSYTQLEYEYAELNNKPVFALVLDETWIDKKARSLGTNASDDYRTQHRKFKAQVLKKHCAMVDDVKDIKLEVLQSMSTFAEDKRLLGWVRSNEYAKSQALIEELTQSLRDLRNAKNGPPTKEELDHRFLSHLEDLATITTKSTQKFPNSDFHEITFTGSALDFIVTLQDTVTYIETNSASLTGYQISSTEISQYLATFASRAGLRIETLFEVWGLGSIARLSSLGYDFVGFVKTRHRADVDACWTFPL